jgi:hypothetical protein
MTDDPGGPSHTKLFLVSGNFGDRYFGTDAVPDGSDDDEAATVG